MTAPGPIPHGEVVETTIALTVLGLALLWLTAVLIDKALGVLEGNLERYLESGDHAPTWWCDVHDGPHPEGEPHAACPGMRVHCTDAWRSCTACADDARTESGL